MGRGRKQGHHVLGEQRKENGNFLAGGGKESYLGCARDLGCEESPETLAETPDIWGLEA